MNKASFFVILFLTFSMLSNASSRWAIAQNQALILPSHSGYLDNSTIPLTYHVVGETINVGTVSLRWLNVTASFYAQDNSFIGSDSSFALLDVLLPNRKAPFEVIWIGASANQICSYSLSLSFNESAIEKPLALQILESAVHKDEAGFTKTNGTVTNLAKSNATAVRVAATFYDAQGIVIDVDYGYTYPSTIMPDSTEPFEFELGRKVSSYSSYSLEVESIEYASIGMGMAIDYGTAYASSTTVTLILLSSGPQSAVQMRFSNDNATFTDWEPFSFSKIWTLEGGDGGKTVYAQLRDELGSSSSYYDTVILDTTPPEITIIYPSSGSSTESSLTIRWMGFDATSGIGSYSIKLDNGSQVNLGLNTTQVYTYLTDGEHSVTVTAKDLSGLSKQTSVIFSVNLDPLAHIDAQTVAVIVATLTIVAVLITAFWARHSKSEKNRRSKLRAKKK